MKGLGRSLLSSSPGVQGPVGLQVPKDTCRLEVLALELPDSCGGAGSSENLLQEQGQRPQHSGPHSITGRNLHACLRVLSPEEAKVQAWQRSGRAERLPRLVEKQEGRNYLLESQPIRLL